MKYIILSILLVYTSRSVAQNIDSIYIIVLQDGSEITGEILINRVDSLSIFAKSLGYLSFAQSDIDTIYLYDGSRVFEEFVDEQTWFTPPITSINFLTETAFALEEGESYYQNVLFFGNKFGYGITNRFTINGGFEWYSIAFETGYPAFLIAPKYTFTNTNSPVQMAIGSNFLLSPNYRSYDLGGTLYGVATIGNVNYNLSLGVGLVYSSGEIADIPVFQLSGQARLSRHFAFIVDSLTAKYDSYYLNTLGSSMLRYMTDTWLVDIGVVLSLDDNFALPLANFAIKF